MGPKIENRELSGLIPYARNSRKHSDSQINQIAASIKEFGFLSPCVISSDGTIIAGHGRVLAAMKAGLDTVPCVIADHLTEGQRRAYVLIDNRLTDTSEWDKEMLQLELGDLAQDYPDIDISEMGFSPEEIAALDLSFGDESGTVGLTDEDAVPETPATPTTKTGDIWMLGNHRVMCGDSTDAASVALLMAGTTPIIMVTDPPYGINYDAEWRGAALGDKVLGKCRTGKVSNDNNADWTAVWQLAQGVKIAYIWHASAFADVVMKSLRDAEFDVRQQIIWNKSVAAMSRSAYHWKHEPCWYAVKKGSDANWVGDRKQITVWDAASPLHIMGGSKEEKTPHPTQKPVALYEIPIGNHTHPADGLYDPFIGSGTALIACEKTGRHCFGMEIDPHYCDVIIKRWQDFTGRLATLEGDGRSFEEIQRERVG